MKRNALALLVGLLPVAAAAGPEGQWPPEARGQVLPRPDWVLVVPVTRDDAGKVSAWNRADPWTRQWVVPRAVGGLRTVAVTGDSEDARLVDGEQLDHMDISALRRLTGKYGAPAVAIVVADSHGSAAVAAWRPGHAAVWDKTRPRENAKEGALRVIRDLFSGERGPRFTITGVRTMGGTEQYRLSAQDRSHLDRLRTVDGIEIVEILETERPSAVVTVTDGRHIEDVLEGLLSR
jgi:hypothetical protein